MPSPAFANVPGPGPRGTPRPGTHRTPALRNVRPIEAIYPHEAPDQIKQGLTPARPARQQIATFLAIDPYHAVMRDDFWVNIISPERHTASALGRSLPFNERANIGRGQPVAYGSLHMIQPAYNVNNDPKLNVTGPLRGAY